MNIHKLPAPTAVPVQPFRVCWRISSAAAWRTRYYATCKAARDERRQLVGAGYQAEAQRWSAKGERWEVV